MIHHLKPENRHRVFNQRNVYVRRPGDAVTLAFHKKMAEHGEEVNIKTIEIHGDELHYVTFSRVGDEALWNGTEVFTKSLSAIDYYRNIMGDFVDCVWVSKNASEQYDGDHDGNDVVIGFTNGKYIVTSVSEWGSTTAMELHEERIIKLQPK